MEAALVSFSLTEENNKQFLNTHFTSSGIKIDDQWILTHGSLISVLKAATLILKTKPNFDSFPNNKNYNRLPKVYVTYEKTYKSKSHDGENFLNNIIVSPGRIKFIWQSILLGDIFNSLFNTWTIGNKPGNCDSQDDSARLYFPVFVLVNIGDSSINTSPREVFNKIYNSLHRNIPQRSDEVFVFGTPFGNEVFLNSLTRGVISNTVGRASNILLCDAPTSIGFEGGPVFSKKSDKLVGMTISSLSWWRGEWVGITLVAFLAPVFHEILFPSEKYKIEVLPSSKDLPFVPLLGEIDKVIALVRCGETWGSGVFIGNRYILTCSHCVIEHKNNPVSVYLAGKTMQAKVVFKTRDDKAYDLALLKVDGLNSNDHIQMADVSSFKGENVVAVGFPFFNEKQIKDLKPTITKGTVNNLTPSMIQTTCCVQSGFSGGAILRICAEDNKLKFYLLGIIVCNAKDDSNHVIFPNLNMAVPVTAFKEVILNYLKNPTSINVLRELENSEQSVQSLWKLQLYNSKL